MHMVLQAYHCLLHQAWYLQALQQDMCMLVDDLMNVPGVRVRASRCSTCCIVCPATPRAAASAAQTHMLHDDLMQHMPATAGNRSTSAPHAGTVQQRPCIHRTAEQQQQQHSNSRAGLLMLPVSRPTSYGLEHLTARAPLRPAAGVAQLTQCAAVPRLMPLMM
jgi:hypothetical protein